MRQYCAVQLTALFAQMNIFLHNQLNNHTTSKVLGSLFTNGWFKKQLRGNSVTLGRSLPLFCLFLHLRYFAVSTD